MEEISKQLKCNAQVRLPREVCDEHVYAVKMSVITYKIEEN